MAIYRVATPPVVNDKGESVVQQRFAPSDGAAKAFRRELAEANSLKLNEVTIEPADVRTGKAGTIAYLNAFHAQAPAGYSPEGYPKEGKKKAAKKR